MTEVEFATGIAALDKTITEEKKLVEDLGDALARPDQPDQPHSEKSGNTVYSLLSKAYQRHIGIIDGLTLAKEIFACGVIGIDKEDSI